MNSRVNGSVYPVHQAADILFCKGNVVPVGKLKGLLTESLNAYLAPIRARRAELAKDPGYVASVLRRGIERANIEAEGTIGAVRKAMGMIYGA